jgi:photosystem II stability/assembly factor-like uncharacterized protein
MRFTALFLSTILCAASAHAAPWQLQNSGRNAGLRGIHAVDSNIVWASGTDGTILRSTDGGNHWQHCTIPPDAAKLDFRAIWAGEATTALALSSGPGDLSRLYQTTDGCNTWKLLFTNPNGMSGFWDGLLFLSRKQGFIYGDPVADGQRTDAEEIPLFMTHDAGLTWARVSAHLPSLPGESAFAASNSAMTTQEGQVWLGTSKARVLRSGNRLNWQSAQTPLASGNDSSGVFSLAFRDREHGVAVGGDYRKPDEATGTAAFTADGGAHWTAAAQPPHGYRSAVAWDEAAKAWISAGTNGSDISYDDGKTWQWLDSGNWNALSLPWAVGPRGRIGKLGTLAATPAAGKAVSR